MFKLISTLLLMVSPICFCSEEIQDVSLYYFNAAGETIDLENLNANNIYLLRIGDHFYDISINRHAELCPCH